MPSVPLGALDATADTIGFTKGQLVYRELSSYQDLVAAYNFRYKICVQKMHWVSGDPITRTESDEFDTYSYHFGVFSESVLVGYCRLTPDNAPSSTMSRKYFSNLLHDGHDYPRHNAADISRLIIDMEWIGKDKRRLKTVLVNLYRLVYGRSELAQPMLTTWYFVTTPILLKGLRFQLLLPVKEIGRGTTPDGKTTHLAMIHLPTARARLRLLAPMRYIKFNRTKRLLIKP